MCFYFCTQHIIDETMFEWKQMLETELHVRPSQWMVPQWSEVCRGSLPQTDSFCEKKTHGSIKQLLIVTFSHNFAFFWQSPQMCGMVFFNLCCLFISLSLGISILIGNRKSDGNRHPKMCNGGASCPRRQTCAFWHPPATQTGPSPIVQPRHEIAAPCLCTSNHFYVEFPKDVEPLRSSLMPELHSKWALDPRLPNVSEAKFEAQTCKIPMDSPKDDSFSLTASMNNHKTSKFGWQDAVQKLILTLILIFILTLIFVFVFVFIFYNYIHISIQYLYLH